MKDSYVTIQYFMVSELNLKGNELLVYAIIFGFSQDEDSEFSGSRKYLADWCNTSVRSIQNVLNSLIEKKLIIKKENIQNNVKLCRYVANFLPREKISPGSEKISPGVVKKFHRGSEKFSPNNIIYNINNNKKENNNINIITKEKPKDCELKQFGDDFGYVQLTQDFYNKLVENKNKILVSQAINKLDAWLANDKQKSKRNQSHQGYFKSNGWVWDISNYESSKPQPTKINWSSYRNQIQVDK